MKTSSGSKNKNISLFNSPVKNGTGHPRYQNNNDPMNSIRPEEYFISLILD